MLAALKTSVPPSPVIAVIIRSSLFSSPVSLASVAAAPRMSLLFLVPDPKCSRILNYVFNGCCGLDVEHPWHASFRFTEVQLPVTARLTRAH